MDKSQAERTAEGRPVRDVTACPRLLVVETSGRVGQVAMALGADLIVARQLDEARKHARDLAPAVRELLLNQDWTPRLLDGVIVSQGPGSYTGLRVGLMSAKTLAYATGARLIAVETFAVIATQAPPEAVRVDVVGDAQQDKVYVQRFRRADDSAWHAETPLRIEAYADWLTAWHGEGWVSGPGLKVSGRQPPADALVAAAESWDPGLKSLLTLGLTRYHGGETADVWTAEPLYLRPSSAEENWDKQK